MRRLIWITIIMGLSVWLVYSWDAYVARDTAPNIYTNIKKLPAKRAALLLGTSKYVRGGHRNYFYTYRIRAAVRLWRARKVKAIVVSGDNGVEGYDETTTMYHDLIAAGVPARYITRDYAGFRTLDSIVRAKAIFGLEDYIVISQKFHLERALLIARAKGQKVVGFVAKDLAGTRSASRMKFREYLARVKAFLDLYILGTEPKFYGKREFVRYRR